jgi:plastocyanin
MLTVRFAAVAGLTALALLWAPARPGGHGLLAGPRQRDASGASRIRGLVEVPRPAPASVRRPSVTALGMSPRAEAQAPQPSVVYLENGPTGAFDDRPAARVQMTQRDETFIPHVLAVRVGTTVDFPNEDETYHNVFSLSKVRRFDLGRYAAGHSKPVRFDRAGVVRVFCDIHSHMNAFVLVFNHRFFDTTDAGGRYEIGAVPPGRYTVLAWHDGSVRDSRVVTVPEGGQTVELDFVLP